MKFLKVRGKEVGDDVLLIRVDLIVDIFSRTYGCDISTTDGSIYETIENYESVVCRLGAEIV